MKCQLRERQIHTFLEELFDRYKLPLLKMVYKNVGDSDVCEDLFQDIFIRIITKAEFLYTLPKPKLEAYIFLIAKGVSFDYLRKKYKNEEIDFEDDRIEIFWSEQDQVASSNVDEFQKAELAMMLESLPAEDKMLLVGKYYLGLDTKELASIVGGTEVSVRSKIHRARKRTFQEWTKLGISMEDFFDD